MTESLQHLMQNYGFLPKQSHEARQGDWICMRCNNLNFSFRKKCNRCKIQTREQNDHNLLQVYQYYQQYYQQSNIPTDYSAQRTMESDLNQQVECVDITLPEQLVLDEYFEECSGEISLPSVSPYVKLYKKQKTTPKTEISDGFSSEEQGSFPQQFLQEYCWQNILIDQDVQNELCARDSCDFWDCQIQKLVQNIVI